jgi:hypothetical protein
MEKKPTTMVKRFPSPTVKYIVTRNYRLRNADSIADLKKDRLKAFTG